jgi:hypothetical protein
MKITILVGILALIAFDSTVVTSESQAKVQVDQKFLPPSIDGRGHITPTNASNPIARWTSSVLTPANTPAGGRWGNACLTSAMAGWKAADRRCEVGRG